MFQGLQGLQGLQAPKIILSDAQRTILEALQRGTRVAQHFQQRATVVLLAASGQKNKTIAQEMAINHNTMKRWV
jgi:DNA-binding NarL/FixJ family response regulator